MSVLGPEYTLYVRSLAVYRRPYRVLPYLFKYQVKCPFWTYIEQREFLLPNVYTYNCFLSV